MSSATATRRAIFELVAERPRPVGEIAAQLPVTRPAVSQHLKVLKEAGLVADRAEDQAHLPDRPRGARRAPRLLRTVLEHDARCVQGRRRAPNRRRPMTATSDTPTTSHHHDRSSSTRRRAARSRCSPPAGGRGGRRSTTSCRRSWPRSSSSRASVATSSTAASTAASAPVGAGPRLRAAQPGGDQLGHRPRVADRAGSGPHERGGGHLRRGGARAAPGRLEHRHFDRHGEGWQQMRDEVGAPGRLELGAAAVRSGRRDLNQANRAARTGANTRARPIARNS